MSSIHICWYQGQGHLQRSRSNIKVTFLKKRPLCGHSCLTNTSYFFGFFFNTPDNTEHNIVGVCNTFLSAYTLYKHIE